MWQGIDGTWYPDQPWERLGEESARAYQAFVTYRDMGPGRSIGKVAAATGKTVSMLEGWSTEHAWVRRAAAWDAEQQRQSDAAHTEARRAAVLRHGQLGAAVLAQVARHLTAPDKPDGTPLTEAERRRWKAKPEVVRMAAYAVRYGTEIERLALGLPTAITRTQADTERLVKEVLEAQRIVMGIVSEGLCDDPACECCGRIRGRLAQATDYQRRVGAEMAP